MRSLKEHMIRNLRCGPLFEFQIYEKRQEMHTHEEFVAIQENHEKRCSYLGVFFNSVSKLYQKSLLAESRLLQNYAGHREAYLVDIGDGNYLNTLHVTPKVPENQHLVMLHGYGAGLGFFYKNYQGIPSH
jgi:hypothetical protein